MKGIQETKFVIFGQTWNVWDWTVFVIVLSALFVSIGLTLLFCICCGRTKDMDEEELEEELKIERTKHELLALREMNKHNIGGRLKKA